MLKAFENTLRQYNAFAHDTNPDERALADLSHWATKKFGTDRGTQDEIFRLQQAKAEIMQQLHKNLEMLNQPHLEKPYDVAERPTHWQDGEFKSLNLYSKEEEMCTVGEIMTGLEWGLVYRLDERTPKKIRKAYYIAQAKNELSSLLDSQILTNELGSSRTEPGKMKAYGKIKENRESAIDSQPAGLIAEKMVRNLLNKINIDLNQNKALPEFEIMAGDAYQDVTNKVDFLIRRKKHNRGVKVETNKNNLGIQFTINQDAEVIAHKENQVEKAKKKLRADDNIDDIVLVSLPLKSVSRCYHSWLETKSAGGPDKLLDRDDKISIFINIMKDLLLPEEIESYCQKI
jgi:hypothetical protein